MLFSNRILSISDSKTSESRIIAAQMKKEGKNIISLSAGEIDTMLPDYFKKAVIDSLNNEKQIYLDAAGLPALRNKISNIVSLMTGREYQMENVIVTNGAKHGLSSVFFALLNPGDEVIIPKPFWGTYEEQVNMSGGKVVWNNDDISSENGINDVIESLITKNTRLIVINTPNNPTGKIFSSKEMLEIAKIAVKHDIYILLDICYHNYIYIERSVIPDSIKEYLDRFIIVDSFSKSFAITGWRIGYVCGNQKLIKKIRSLQSHTTSNVCSLLQYSMLRILENDYHKFIELNKNIMNKNRLDAIKELENTLGLNFIAPDGGFYIYLTIDPDSYKSLDKDIRNISGICNILLREKGVSVTPGAAFGDTRGIRISLCSDNKELIYGLRKIKEFHLSNYLPYY